MYFKKDTRLPRFMPQPVFLQSMELSITARQLYTLLLNRTTLSQKNNWVDQQGRVYVIYTVENMAADLGRSRSSIMRTLKELDAVGLIRRIRQGWSIPNHIYVVIPDCAEFTTPEKVPEMTPEKVPEVTPEKGSSVTPEKVSNWDPNYTEKNKTEYNKQRREGAKRLSPVGYGLYQNVVLSPELRQQLVETYGAAETAGCIDRLSEYMQSTGRRYADHGAVLNKWLREDRAKQKESKGGWAPDPDVY